MTVNAFYLSEWIHEATRDLCDDARDRVTLEIQAQYADKLAAELAQGRAEGDAHALALASLGSAKAARKAYDRTYWTKGDQWYFKNMVALRFGSKLSATIRLVLLSLGAACMAGCIYLEFDRRASAIILALFVLWVASVLCFVSTGLYGTWHAPTCYRKGRLRAAVAWLCISTVIPYVLLAMLLVAGSLLIQRSDGNFRVLVISGGAALVIITSAFALWEYRFFSRKLKHASQTPAPNAGLL